MLCIDYLLVLELVEQIVRIVLLDSLSYLNQTISLQVCYMTDIYLFLYTIVLYDIKQRYKDS